MPEFPNLIFAEQHNDPITARILCKLIPRLKKLGYTSFLDESANGYIFNNNITLTNALKAIKFDIANTYAIKPKQISDIEKNLVTSEFSWRYFLIKLEKYKMNYIGADSIWASNLIAAIENQNIYDFLYKINIDSKLYNIFTNLALDLTRPFRNHCLSKFYLETKEQFFAKIGAAHLEGIQNNIAKSISITAANKSFCFFHIYSTFFFSSVGRKDSADISNYPIETYEEDVRMLSYLGV